VESEDTSPTRPPALHYFADPSNALVPVVRTVGVVAAVLGVLRFIWVPFHVLTLRQQWVSFGTNTSFFRLSWLLAILFYLVSAVWLIVAGTLASRRAPRGQKVLTTWAWTTVAWGGLTLAVNAAYLVSRTPFTRNEFAGLAMLLEQLMVMIVFPAIVLVLMRQTAVKQVFESR
jgi:hypothetical protein